MYVHTYMKETYFVNSTFRTICTVGGENSTFSFSEINIVLNIKFFTTYNDISD
jgi:hypothetical protein